MEQIPNGTPQQPKRGMCVLSVTIIIVGIILALVAISNAKELATDRSGYLPSVDYTLMKAIVVASLLNCLGSIALAVIVDACNKYRNS